MLVASFFQESVMHLKVDQGRLNFLKRPRRYEIDISFPDVKLAVEIDGGVHNIPERKEQDARKTKFLEGLGWKVLRYSNRSVTQDIHNVVADIQYTISKLKGTQATA